MSNKSHLLLSTLILLCSAVASPAQTQTSINPVIPTQKVERRIVYTGKLLGHFRVPSLQDANFNRCPDLGETRGGASDAALEFLKLRAANPNATLVGTGDNFAPQLEARTFSPVPKDRGPKKYSHGNKELFHWDGTKWVDYDKLPDDLEKKLRDGLGTIPNDNVGCFLAAANYAAIVPGKHDFYFGADRVRLLARFMAGIKSSTEYEPVQMLGANLVMSTSEIESQALLPRDKETPWWTGSWPEEYPVLNLEDESSVYPWYSYVKIKLIELKLDVKQTAVLKEWLRKQGGLVSEDSIRAFLIDQKEPFPTLKANLEKAIEGFKNIAISRCPSEGEPNQIVDPRKPADPRKPGCTALTEKQIGLSGNSLAYFITVPKEITGKNGHFSTVKAGKNYGLCSVVSGKDVNCIRFAVYRPFLSHPHDVSQITDSYIDPDPYVLTKDGVAIFGVVDTALSEHVGVLNFGWQHEQPELKTLVSAEDPAEALRQQLDYFERRCRDEKTCNFTGLKVLLAQMSPQRARVLGARLPEFQVIVTGADAEQGTSLTTLSSVWTPNSRAGSFVAVPLPGFDRAAKGPVALFSEVDASQNGTSWNLNSKHIDDPQPFKTSSSDMPEFWKRVTAALSSCVPSRLVPKVEALERREKLEWLTLCALREKLGSDVALVQNRDFFDVIPEGKTDTPENTQEFLDRLIWKGDLLTLMFVRGSALKQAIKDSKKFAAEDASPLSLADEKSRQLKILGIETDKATGESLIKELPVDESKIYAVATTDYIGAGDTGYPALAEAALNPRTYPAAFPRTLTTLSGAVCRKIFPEQADADKYCLGDLDRIKYLDETVASLVAAQKPPGFFEKAWDNFLFKLPPKDTVADNVPSGFQEMAQRRPFWILSVRNLSFGFTHLGNSLTDAELDANFAGVPITAVQAHKNHTLTVGLNTRISHFTHDREFFLAGGIDFKKESTGVSNDEPVITQSVNRIFLDPGVTFRFPGKSLPHWGLVLSVHLETPFQSPVSTFTLASERVVDAVNNIKVNDRLEIAQGRSIQVLPRLGLRLQNKDSFVEFGGQAGYEMRALAGYRFNTPGVPEPVECLLSAAETLAKCITNKSDAGMITRDSEPSAILENRKRAGLYWKIGFSMPFGEKIKYELEDEGNYFFVKFHEDTSVDTRLLDVSKHRLRFFIWPSISIGPTYQLLFYRNKRRHHWLTQRQFGFETVIDFDLFNRRERQIQFKNKP